MEEKNGLVCLCGILFWGNVFGERRAAFCCRSDGEEISVAICIAAGEGRVLADSKCFVGSVQFGDWVFVGVSCGGFFDSRHLGRGGVGSGRVGDGGDAGVEFWEGLWREIVGRVVGPRAIYLWA